MTEIKRDAASAGRIFFCVMLLICAMQGLCGRSAMADPVFPSLSGRIVDGAVLLSVPAEKRLSAWLEEFERASGKQIVVVTVTSLQGYPVEVFAYRLGRAWGIGEKGKNTGAILLVAPKERAVRIEVGYGLEGELTDAASRAIIENNILPAFRRGDYEAGILSGTSAILKVLGWRGDGQGNTARMTQGQEGPPPIAIIIFIILFVLLRFVRGGRGIHRGRHGPGVWGASSRRGFSGGGGSFGGGGASGRW